VIVKNEHINSDRIEAIVLNCLIRNEFHSKLEDVESYITAVDIATATRVNVNQVKVALQKLYQNNVIVAVLTKNRKRKRGYRLAYQRCSTWV
jgi:transcription initiation factor IIE alpha subunit